MKRLQPICSKCHKPISTILEPCTNCGYQPKLTKFGKQLQEEHRNSRKKDKQLSEDIQENLKRRAWNHYAIDDTIQGHHVRIPRCDKYSDYALVLSCVFMRDVEEVLKELLEK